MRFIYRSSFIFKYLKIIYRICICISVHMYLALARTCAYLRYKRSFKAIRDIDTAHVIVPIIAKCVLSATQVHFAILRGFDEITVNWQAIAVPNENGNEDFHPRSYYSRLVVLCIQNTSSRGHVKVIHFELKQILGSCARCCYRIYVTSAALLSQILSECRY